MWMLKRGGRNSLEMIPTSGNFLMPSVGPDCLKQCMLRCGRGNPDLLQLQDAGSIYRPHTGRGEFEQMAVRVPKVEAPSAQFPLALLFHGNPSLFQPRLPLAQFSRRNR